MGVEVIKRASQEAFAITKEWKFSAEEKPLTFTIVSPPTYKIEMVMKNKKEGKERIKAFFDVLKREVEKHGGKCLTEQGIVEGKIEKAAEKAKAE